MVAKKATIKAPSKSDYAIPGNSEWTDPCPGSVGSPTNLLDVEKQVQENENAFRENRKAQALAIHCPFCVNYHLEMQPPVESLIGGEAVADYIDVSPPPVEEPPVDEAATQAGILAVTPQTTNEDEELEELLNDDTGSSSENSDS